MSESEASKVDVLIIGAGPSGLMVATWLAHLGVSTRVIDKRGTRALVGRADGVFARTLEILDSFKLGDALRENCFIGDDMVVWAPGADGKGIHLVNRQLVWGTETSFTKPITTHQGHVEAVLLDGLRHGKNPVEVERAVQPIDIHVDAAVAETNDPDAYPVTVTVKSLNEDEADVWTSNAHTVLTDGSIKSEPGTKDCTALADGTYQTTFQTSSKEGQIEIIKAKYVIGADGAHSWVRRQIGLEMQGTSTDGMWGVMDFVPITDYPDIRRQGPIMSGKHEPIVNVPRENGMNRFYVFLPADYAEKNSIEALSDPSRDVCKTIISTAREAMHPYKLDYEYCDWYTLYSVGRRLASAYSDPTQRVFIAGDACHTHTPKGGQGMNTSIQDSYNLGWKIAGVVKGQLKKDVLATYGTERRPIGQKLVDLDEALNAGLGGASKDRMPLMEVYDQLRKLSDGRLVVYDDSLAVGDRCSTSVAPGITLGSRFPNHHVRSQASTWQQQTIKLFPSDGRWRLVVYGGDVSIGAQLERVNKLGSAISGLVGRYQSITPSKPWLEALLIHGAALDAADTFMFDPIFRPKHEAHGGVCWYQIWADAPAPLPPVSESAGEAHRTLGIDPQVGAMALVRPDTFVAWVGGYEEFDDLEKFCAGNLEPSETVAADGTNGSTNGITVPVGGTNSYADATNNV